MEALMLITELQGRLLETGREGSDGQDVEI